MGESSLLGEANESGRMIPAAATVRCASCQLPIDPLRASRVAFFGERFRYFCSPECRAEFKPGMLVTPLPSARRRSSSRIPVVPTLNDEALASGPRAAWPLVDEQGFELPGGGRDASNTLAYADGGGEFVSQDDSAQGDGAPAMVELPSHSDISTLLLGLAVLGGSLAVVLALAGESSVALDARLVAGVVGAAALLTHHLTARRDPSEPSRIAVLTAPLAGIGLAIATRLSGADHTSAAITLAGIITGVVAAAAWLMQRAEQGFAAERQHILDAIDQPGNRVVGDETILTEARELRPGEEIVVGTDEVLPVDATVVAGSATVLPWQGAKLPSLKAEGDTLVAGAKVVDGRLRLVVSWAGYDRAWTRLTHDTRRRADLHAGLARFGRLTAERAAPLAAGLAALTAFASDHDLVEIALFALAAQAALAQAGLARIGSLHVARTLLNALRRGIVFRTAEAFDKAGRVSNVAFCARGTLLLGEPEVANVEPIPPKDAASVLALVAGAESGATHPVATAMLRAARARGVRPDGVRSPSYHAGLGVTAVASNGQPLVVGSRALMLKERISVARAESQITELEAMGRTVMLVALGGKLIGVIGLQDGLRPGARAAVQYLLDVGVEPVLLSGDARETCEALGRALDIEHIRPEVLPGDRGDEIRCLADGGAVVAVIGRSSVDESALTAADVPISLGTAGSSTAEWSVQLASDDVRDAANAIRLAHRCRAEARLGLALTLGPSVGAVLALSFGLFTPTLTPIVALAGAIGAVLRLRSLED